MSSSNLINYFKELSSTAIVVFVKQQNEMSERMKNVYQNIKELTNAEIRRMSVEEVLHYNNTLLNKISHVFVLDNFSGSSYDHLMSKKAGDLRIFGVPLLEIISDETLVITNSCAIYNNAFEGLKICTSNLNGTEKKKLESLVKSMNGQFTNELSSDVTHLITNSTKTIKYSDAASLDIPIYHTEWVYQIWNKCQKQEGTITKACSEQNDVFKLPPLFDLKIATTGMNKDQRNEISDIIEENGGKFEEIFKSNETDILIMDKKDIDNSKFKIAAKYKIPVLNVNWIHESVNAGYALSYNDFAFKRPKSFDSSSSSHNDSTNVSLDDSKKSEGDQEKKEEISKTNNTVLVDKTNDQLVSTLTIEQQAKKLGHVFDGYVFYLYNFTLEHYFKVGKLISSCGGIRVKELDSSITHILCFNKEKLEDFHKRLAEKEVHGSLIDYKWLVECLKQGKLLSETDYQVTADSTNSKKIVPPSPMSKKAIQSLVFITKSTDMSKKENSKSNKVSKKESSIGTSSKMLDFSSHDDLIQPSIEATHRKLKQVPNFTSSKKRSYEADYCQINENSKRRKTTDDEECTNSFQVL
ncbi:DNA topoisomerase 2-binding protein 1-like [Chironomus tepperi]|uniref:DNA topoisomerase 2-binding protein 1-like n=1 Tax=Chironomus tepperi TaxID=113505 RepID=UPI00391F2E12